MSKPRLTHKERHKNNFLKTRPIGFASVREPMLIVCEDSKSSVLYFKEKRDALRLETTKVKVTGDSASHPSSVVEFARIERDKNKAECKKSRQTPYKHVYCVFDVDDHPNLAAAIQHARDLGLIPIVSNEAFELWYLLHFLDAKPGYMRRDELNKRLSQFLGKQYDKSATGMYNLIKNREPNAIKISEQLLQDAIQLSPERNPFKNPSTEIHIIINKLNSFVLRPSL